MEYKRHEVPSAVQAIQASPVSRIKHIALGFAIIVGVIALYFCLLPALAQDGKAYLYFDNSLSQYDSVACYVNGNEIQLERLGTLPAGDPRIPADTSNISMDKVYVTVTEVEVGATV